MKLLPLILLLLMSLGLVAEKPSAASLPLKTTFIGKNKFQAIATKATSGQWSKLPMGKRMVRVAKELEGLPYLAYSLEIDDHIESPSVNFKGMDCWTFFEICLGFSRMLEVPQTRYRPEDLLKQIEWTRYRDGRCRGNYLDRIHYLAEWYADNHRRSTIKDITNQFPTKEMKNQCNEMTKLWQSYRYLKQNPELRQGMATHEKRLSQMTVRMIPKNKVKGIEHKLQEGDIIGIARHKDGSYCSHVGIIIKDKQGRSRFMHASTTYRKVVIDDTLSNYLQQFDKHAGILVARPQSFYR